MIEPEDGTVEEREPARPAGGQPASSGEGEAAFTPEMEADFKAVLEALLFSASTPLTAARLTAATNLPVPRIKQYLADLKEEYDRTNRAFSLEEIAGGYQLLTRAEFSPFVQKLQRGRASDKLTQAQMETLAIVAYKQPIIRADVEAIRGVQSGQILRSLLERRLIRVTGRDERVGHPLLYGTTRRFLEVFGLKSLKDLPTLEELKTI